MSTRSESLEAVLGDLPGRPYLYGARGPASFDCWGLVLEVRRRLGLVLPPDFAFAALDVAAVRALFDAPRPTGWHRSDPTLGAVVLAPEARHAGIVVARRVLHAHKAAGVIAWALGTWSTEYGTLDCWQAGEKGGTRHG